MSQLVITSLKAAAVLIALLAASQSSARPLEMPVHTVQLPEAPALALSSPKRTPTLTE